MDAEFAVDHKLGVYEYEEAMLNLEDGQFSQRVKLDFPLEEQRAFLRSEGKARIKRERR